MDENPEHYKLAIEHNFVMAVQEAEKQIISRKQSKLNVTDPFNFSDAKHRVILIAELEKQGYKIVNK